MPLITTRANFASTSAFGKSASAGIIDTGVMFPLGMVEVTSGSVASITFSSIPATYKHLQLRCFAYSTNTNSNDAGGYNTTFNSDTGNNYSYHYLIGNGSGTPSSAGAASVSSMILGFINSSNYPSSAISTNIIDIYDYSNTNKYKTATSQYGHDGNGAGFIGFTSGNWRSNLAINSITITPWSGSYATYSIISLYGIEGE
jgi:hypothetical protein